MLPALKPLLKTTKRSFRPRKHIIFEKIALFDPKKGPFWPYKDQKKPKMSDVSTQTLVSCIVDTSAFNTHSFMISDEGWFIIYKSFVTPKHL